MKVLLAHARYALPGGEEQVVELQASVLAALGHDVFRYEEDNREIDVRGGAAKARSAANSVWSRGSRERVATLIAKHRPDVVHVHNTFPAMSPSVIAAANSAGVRVVQHLHNARLVCVQPFLLRDGAECTDCVGRRVPYPGVVHRCYRGSATQSAVATTVQLTHRAIGTWRRRVDLFLAVSQSLADVIVSGGAVPADKVAVCHNALAADPGVRDPASDEGYALYLGRLSTEKGVDTVIDAAARVRDLPVVIAGDGPERGALEARARSAGATHVRFVGHVDRPRVLALLRGARVLLAPSRGQEPFGMAVVEAAAVGVPAIASTAGALPEIVGDGKSGLLVPPSDPAALAAAMMRALDAGAMASMGSAARRRYEQRFTSEQYGARLVGFYEAVIADHRRRAS